MNELRELYQEVILDHSRNPHNFRFPEDANRSADGFNPLCGDRLTIKLVLEGDVVRDIGFQGSGCAISTAAASTMTDAVKGRTLAEVEKLFERFHELVTGQDREPDFDALGKLAVFSGVSEFPMRVKCATLCWHTLQSAVAGEGEQVSTE